MSNKYSTSVTGLMDFIETPFHFYNGQILKNRPTSKAMLEGRALHLAVLEPERFESEVYVNTYVPEGKVLVDTVADLKAYLDKHEVEYVKSWKKDQLLEQFLKTRTEKRDKVHILKNELNAMFEEKTQITEGSMDSIIKMRDSVLAHPWVKSNLHKGEKERKLVGEIHGVEIRGRMDWDFETSQPVIADLKKCRSARRWNWEKTVYENKYYIQAYLYSQLYRQNFGKDPLYAYIAAEGQWPYISEVYAADDAQLDAGERMVNMALARLKRCFDEDHWPAYSDGKVQPCSLPEYGFKNIIAQEEWGEEGY